jgi:hypothetical protein
LNINSSSCVGRSLDQRSPCGLPFSRELKCAIRPECYHSNIGLASESFSKYLPTYSIDVGDANHIRQLQLAVSCLTSYGSNQLHNVPRVNALGFPTGPEALQAGAVNLGLQDQIAVLQWIRDNIAAFGGDPSKVSSDSHSLLHSTYPIGDGGRRKLRSCVDSVPYLQSTGSEANTGRYHSKWRGSTVSCSRSKAFLWNFQTDCERPVFQR